MLRRCLICDKPIIKLNTDGSNDVNSDADDKPIDAVCMTIDGQNNGSALLVNDDGVQYQITLCDNCISKHSDVIYKVKDGQFAGRLADDLLR